MNPLNPHPDDPNLIANIAKAEDQRHRLRLTHPELAALDDAVDAALEAERDAELQTKWGTCPEEHFDLDGVFCTRAQWHRAPHRCGGIEWVED